MGLLTTTYDCVCRHNKKACDHHMHCYIYSWIAYTNLQKGADLLLNTACTVHVQCLAVGEKIMAQAHPW